MDDTHVYAEAEASAHAPNPAPPELARRVFILRELVALAIVAIWMVLVVWDTLNGGEQSVPFWFSAVAVGCLAFALGVSVGELTAFRKPSARTVVRALRQGGG